MHLGRHWILELSAIYSLNGRSFITLSADEHVAGRTLEVTTFKRVSLYSFLAPNTAIVIMNVFCFWVTFENTEDMFFPAATHLAS